MRHNKLAVALLIVKKSLSVRATESHIRNFNDTKQVSIDSGADVNPDIKRLEIEVSEKLGAKLSIEHKARGSGKIVINYNDLDELEGILEHIKLVFYFREILVGQKKKDNIK